MLNYHALKSSVKTSLLSQWQQLDIATEPLTWAWITYVLALEEISTNPLLEQAFEQGQRWLDSSGAWNDDSNLAGIALLCHLLHHKQNKECKGEILRIIECIERLKNKGHSKFSRLNDPDFVFCFAIAVKEQLSNELLQWLKQHCERNIQSHKWRRGLLFAAAARELGGNISPFVFNPTDLQVYDIFPVLWFSETYADLIEGEERRRGLWDTFERVKEGVTWNNSDEIEEGLYALPPIDLAMFYSALLKQTQDIDPVILFSNTPLHPAVRRAAESLFIQGAYANSVFEASKVFIDTVKQKANNPNHADDKGNVKYYDGRSLMQKVFTVKNPILKFNSLVTDSEKDEQTGLQLIAEGVVAAFRNPNGHTPASVIPLSSYEAFEQLVIISHLMKRLDSAHL